MYLANLETQFTPPVSSAALRVLPTNLNTYPHLAAKSCYTLLFHSRPQHSSPRPSSPFQTGLLPKNMCPLARWWWSKAKLQIRVHSARGPNQKNNNYYTYTSDGDTIFSNHYISGLDMVEENGKSWIVLLYKSSTLICPFFAALLLKLSSHSISTPLLPSRGIVSQPTSVRMFSTLELTILLKNYHFMIWMILYRDLFVVSIKFRLTFVLPFILKNLLTVFYFYFLLPCLLYL